MSEPLDGKGLCICSQTIEDESRGDYGFDDLFTQRDIKSAVNWFRERIDGSKVLEEKRLKSYVNKLVKKAFKDIPLSAKGSKEKENE